MGKFTVKFPHIFINDAECKRCSSCKEYLPLDYFAKKTRNKDGLATECKPCQSAYNCSEERKSKRRTYCKEYYENNKEKLSEYIKEYKSKNKERLSYLAEKNKEHVCLLRRIRYTRPEVKEVKRVYDKKKRLEKDPEYLLIRNISHQKRRTLKANNVSTLTVEQFNECLEFFDNKDAYTGLPMNVISQDHVIPLTKGGSYTRQNIIPCDFCVNSSKSNNDMEEWFRKQTFFSELRLKNIKQWMGYKPNSDILQTSFF